MSQDRILIVSHGHPDFNKGGGEIAAYQMFEELRAQGHDAWFLAAHRESAAYHGTTSFATVREHEVLFYARMHDYFTFSNPQQRVIWKEFGEFLDRIKPTIVHFHHYIHLGIEMLREVRNYEARSGIKVRMVLTLHEYLAICEQNGQMVKRGTNKLCYKSSPVDCAKCYPERKPTDYFLRERYIKSHFNLVDHFVSPSHFLKQRYVDWGLDADKISVIENGQPPAEKLPPRPLVEGESRLRFAYFGQLSPFKGLDVLLESLDHLPKDVKKKVSIHIHGTSLEQVPETFRNKIKPLIEKHRKNVTYYGPYETKDLPRLMADIDWVVMPSVWWENSPLVIQEAFKFGRPIMVSDIGGMGEKVRDKIDGLHFKVGSALNLSQKIVSLSRNDTLWQEFQTKLPSVISSKESTALHLRLYTEKN